MNEPVGNDARAKTRKNLLSAIYVIAKRLYDDQTNWPRWNSSKNVQSLSYKSSFKILYAILALRHGNVAMAIL